MQRYFFISILFFIGAGCTKDYTIQPKGQKQLYVIEGRISNMAGPYYVRITKSRDSFGTGSFSGTDDAEPVLGAQVIIADDMGITDTLVPPDIHKPRYDPAFSDFRGYYQTTKIAGSPGHTYHLQVRIGNETFQASALMPYVPALDSIELRTSFPVIDTNVRPSRTAYAYFKEPQDEQNYYLLQPNAGVDSTYDRARLSIGITSIFPFYVFDDKTLTPYVNGMKVGVILADGNGNGQFSPYPVSPFDSVQVRLCSLTSETYEYFNVLIRQFQDDGNVYKPTPASAKGNISGGALGLFWATGVSYKVAR